ncbi:der1-like domain member 2 [Vairimorpha apis BRL 01]|uniref:Derlin n=1 Tax=Vairimorpha apis BRL 01 TaxID=1037528 RepID=T0L6T4_9MICR|nr:der1-like domain member 2 [Vairimorpha apis BRL 01]
MLFGIANILNLSNLASAFSATITYIWTRKNPHALVQMFGFITFPAFYLPFIVPGFMLITEKRILVEDLLGILVGHVYFFLKEVYPKYGVDVLKTPCLIKKLCNEHQSGCCKNKRGKVLKMRGNSGVKLDGVKNNVNSGD